jgi:hypothetical protein
MVLTLSEIKRRNKEVGQHFFDRGNPSVMAKYGNYLVTKGMGDGWVIYKFDESNGHINLVDNPSGDYSWQPYKSKDDAVRYAIRLSKEN